jgi:hypothetical protein
MKEVVTDAVMFIRTTLILVMTVGVTGSGMDKATEVGVAVMVVGGGCVNDTGDGDCGGHGGGREDKYDGVDGDGCDVGDGEGVAGGGFRGEMLLVTVTMVVEMEGLVMMWGITVAVMTVGVAGSGMNKVVVAMVAARW